MTQPEGYEAPGKKDYVSLLKKSLYGIHQSLRQWSLNFDQFIVTHDFKRCSYDCCVYSKTLNPNMYIYLLLYVNDILIACNERTKIEALKKLLNTAFDMKDFRRAKKILGVEIIRNKSRGLVFLSQAKHLKRVL